MLNIMREPETKFEYLAHLASNLRPCVMATGLAKAPLISWRISLGNSVLLPHSDLLGPEKFWQTWPRDGWRSRNLFLNHAFYIFSLLAPNGTMTRLRRDVVLKVCDYGCMLCYPLLS